MILHMVPSLKKLDFDEIQQLLAYIDKNVAPTAEGMKAPTKENEHILMLTLAKESIDTMLDYP